MNRIVEKAKLERRLRALNRLEQSLRDSLSIHSRNVILADEGLFKRYAALGDMVEAREDLEQQISILEHWGRHE